MLISLTIYLGTSIHPCPGDRIEIECSFLSGGTDTFMNRGNCRHGLCRPAQGCRSRQSS